MKTNRLISIALVTLMALTVVSAAGVLRASATNHDATTADLPAALDCAQQSTNLGWSWGITEIDGGNVQIWDDAAAVGGTKVALLAPTELAYAQINLYPLTGPGSLTFTWQGVGLAGHYGVYDIADLNWDESKSLPTGGSAAPVTITLDDAGPHKIDLTVECLGFVQGQGFADNLHFTPAVTKDTVLSEVTALKDITTQGMFTNTNTHKSFDAKLNAVYKLVEKGTATSYAEAQNKILIDLMPKTDGVTPDWVTDTTDQQTVYDQLQTLYDDIGLLMPT